MVQIMGTCDAKINQLIFIVQVFQRKVYSEVSH